MTEPVHTRPSGRWRPRCWWMGGGLVTAGLLLALWVGFQQYQPVYGGRALFLWAEDLHSPDPKVCAAAERVMRDLDTRGVAALGRALAQPDSRWRGPLAAAREKLPRRWLRSLYRVCQPEKPTHLRRYAARALGCVKPVPDSALAPLVSALEDSDTQVADEASLALRRAGAAATPLVLAALRRPEFRGGAPALRVLKEAQLLPHDALPLLADLLRRGQGPVPRQASEIMAKFGAAALPALFEVLSSPERETRAHGREALLVLVSASSDALIRAADSAPRQSPLVRESLVRVLGQTTPPTRCAASALVAALQDPVHEVRVLARAGLRQHLERAGKALPALVACLGDAQVETRQLAVEVLAELGPAAKPAAEALRARLEDPDPGVRQSARAAIARITGEPNPESAEPHE